MAEKVIRIKAWKRVASIPLAWMAFSLRLFNRLAPTQPDHLVILEPVGLGDVITSEPLIRESAAQKLEVMVLSRGPWRALIPEGEHLSFCEVCLPWASHSGKYRLGMYLRKSFWKPLLLARRFARGAIGIDPRGDIRSVVLLYLIGCKRVLSLSNYLGSTSRIPSFIAETIPFENIPRWRLNLRFLDRLAPQSPLEQGRPPILPHLMQKGKPANRVAFVPIAPWRGKWWSGENWIELAELFLARGMEVVALCGPGQAPATQAELSGKVQVIECDSVENWAEQLNQCSLVISVDSGPMHLADALQIPLIALFGQGYLPLWQPSGKTSVVLTHQHEVADFAPCHQIEENTPSGRELMDRITVQEVMAVAKKLLTNHPPKLL